MRAFDENPAAVAPAAGERAVEPIHERASPTLYRPGEDAERREDAPADRDAQTDKPTVSFRELFSGNNRGYGTYDTSSPAAQPGAKVDIKASVRTVREPVTDDLFDRHLRGEQPLGIVPIRPDGTCLFGAVDIDQYNLNLGELAGRVAALDLPVLPCRSKSGGVHLYLFLSDPQPARAVRALLRRIAEKLGYPGAEIFPKQDELGPEQVGNWINLPYLGGDDTDRYGLKSSGMAMQLAEFEREATKRRLSAEEFVRLQQRFDTPAPPSRKTTGRATPSPALTDFSHAPPCLEALAQNGVPQGGRNNALVAFAVYARKAHGAEWEARVAEYNHTVMKPPLPLDEVMGIIKSCKKKDYAYRCNDQPLCDHCDKDVCRTRQFGVAAPARHPVFSSVVISQGAPVTWTMTLADVGEITLPAEEVFEQRTFLKRCFAELHVAYHMMKQEAWADLLNDAAQSAVKEVAPRGTTLADEFDEHINNFLNNRHRGERSEDILSGRPWEDQEGGRHFFRLRDLAVYVARESDRLRRLSRKDLGRHVRRLGGGTAERKIKATNVSLFWIPSSALEGPAPTIDPPPIRPPPI